ncbi:MAG: ferrous iron transport protein B [Bacteroidales bacterium]|jgi:ferrous iron transport protein B|nr:ferrous iron transport protein B [Bacteroidales bacterium]MDD4176511.1 ferrous iron transport protein B [Bacteroidales bacterium]MDD4740651.1 ferrous iron transport protein B [Bacteroidales bacterium]MDY0333857.1 ferrous iron transport protein B [Bacteroidales bacterium]NCU34584.1 ferrous iron transport protein B [Candidatus Falkowbacteria bacterium]
MNLSELKQGEKAFISKVKGRGAFRKRITEMGFVKGKEVEVIRNAPLRDPIEYRLMNYDVSLRRSEARLVSVVAKKSQVNNGNGLPFQGTISDDVLKLKAVEKGKIIDIALVGNPNSGKTTIFNYASRSREKVGNYGGVTVDAKTAHFKLDGYTFNLVDLPGTYSLSAYSPEELYVRKHILGHYPDIVINVIDASNLERNLYLTTQLIDMDIKVVVALNMYDELSAKGDKFDFQALGKMLGIPFVPTIGSKGKGIRTLFRKVIEVYEDRDPIMRHIHIHYGKPMERGIGKIQDEIWKNKSLTDKVSSRYYAIKLLEKDDSAHFSLGKLPNYADISRAAEREIALLEKDFQDDTESMVIDAKYGFIAGALRETFQENRHSRSTRSETELVDNFLTHRLFGFPIFLFFMWLMFYSTFTLGEYPMQWIDAGFGALNQFVSAYMAPGMLKDLLTDGIISGVGSVLVFLPNILILFFFISLMEDTGYMARVAFIMDRIMHKIGLHGRSFIPLLMGFGCNVPAIMATRTIESRTDRILTILINPFMSCSARLPVYILIIGATFPDYPGTVLFGIYGFGILMAALMAVLFKKTIFRNQEAPFVMELPPYRLPTLKAIVRNMWFKGSQYLQKMGGVILIAVIIIWAAGYFPLHKERMAAFDQQIALAEQQHEDQISDLHLADDAGRVLQLQHDAQLQITRLQQQKASFRLENSYIGKLGHWFQPAIAPLGFDWKMGVALITGAAAKEIVVSTMGVLYQDSEEGTDSSTLSQKIRHQRYTVGPLEGQPVFSPAVALAFLIFVLIYFPCIAVVSAVKKETGGWKWALFLVGYTTVLAYALSFLTYRIGLLLF